jgi:hypothetical protein
MSTKHYITDKSEVMLGMAVEYTIDGMRRCGEIVSFLQTSPDLLYVVRLPAWPELVLVNPDTVDVFEYR